MALSTLTHLELHQVDAAKFFAAFNPAPPMPRHWLEPAVPPTEVYWKPPLRLRVRWRIDDFWRHTILREPLLVEFNTRFIGIDWGIEDFEPPAIDSRAWTGRY